MKGVVSQVANEKVIKAFSIKSCMLSTRDAVSATRQAKLSTLVKAAWRYNVPFLRTQKLHTHTHRYQYYYNRLTHIHVTTNSFIGPSLLENDSCQIFFPCENWIKSPYLYFNTIQTEHITHKIDYLLALVLGLYHSLFSLLVVHNHVVSL